jgi:hypothetical protein
MKTTAHDISISHEHGRYMLHGGHRARCSCGWWSDCYAQLNDTQRAVDVHLHRSRRKDFDALIARSSIGAAIRDVKERGLDAHLADLADLKQEMRRSHKRQRTK